MDLRNIKKPNELPGLISGPEVRQECRPFQSLNGNAEVVVFVHGLTGSPADFQPFVQHYPEVGYDVVVPLLPGHGSHVSYLVRQGFRELLIPLKPLLSYLCDQYCKVHLVGMSYGAVLSAHLGVALPLASLSFFAPAFYLSTRDEKQIAWIRRLRLHRFKDSVSKKKKRTVQRLSVPNYSYSAIPLRLVVELHQSTKWVRDELVAYRGPVFHAHGDQDPTTPIRSNHVFLQRALENYHFFFMENGEHVITQDKNYLRLTLAHLEWLKGL